MNKNFYFTYGTSELFPYQLGWTKVIAPDSQAAFNAFRAYHPNRPGSECLNCADYYSAEEFENSNLFKTGNGGVYCHETITLVRYRGGDCIEG